MASNTTTEELYSEVKIFKGLDEIVWNSQLYNSTELIDLKIPMPIFTRVISDKTQRENLPDNERFYWLQERRTIKRIVANDRHGNQILFPVNCPILFKNLEYSNETDDENLQFLSEILENHEMPIKVRPCLDSMSFKSAKLNDREIPLAWFSDITLMKSYHFNAVIAVDVTNSK
ncbi:uncharacterized protein [Antedon mediterranea]|uniref:uncharacterized protein n=1 Tax=Antedon mediterranea TaxID=105859 RepID=UPI003AF41D8F